MTPSVRCAAVATLAGAVLACCLDANASAEPAAAARVASKAAQTRNNKRTVPKSPTVDFAAIAAAAGLAIESAKTLEWRRDEHKAPAAAGRKLQLQGMGVKYQVNKATAIESGIRLGMEPTSPAGAFIKLQRQLGPR
jgi:hypothetical protein